MDWLDFLAVQGTLKSLLQHNNSKVSILQCSIFFIVQLSYPYTVLKCSQSTFILLSYLIRVFDSHRYRWRETELMKDFAYVCNILKTKKNGRNQPEIVHILLCIFLCLIVFYISFQRGMSIILEVENYLLLKKSKQFKHVFLFHILIIFSSHNSILVFCLLCPDGKCTIKFIQSELIIFL